MKYGTLDLHCDNNMKLMAKYPDNHFDIGVADPPYFEGPNKPGFYRNGKFSSTLVPAGQYGELKHWKVPGAEFFEELKRVSKNQIIWGANHFANRFNFASPGWIVWDKQNGDSSFADAELAYSSFDKAVRICRYRWNGMIQGSFGNKKLNEKRIHPTQKPVALYKWLLQNYAKEGDKILDTHGGSMSIAIACHYMKHDLTLCELDEDYYNAGVERVQRETAQLELF
jgi:site-specific DNA-methyltransferase (adenine-specific)